MRPIVLLSGGLDSAVLLASVTTRRPICLLCDYGQRHKRELWFAFQIAHYYGAEYRRARLDECCLLGSALTGPTPVPHAHYEDPSQAATVVPNRNMVLLSVAAAYAVRLGCDEVLFGAHAGDAAIYPDCRPEFVAAINQAMRLACNVGVRAPFLGMTKRQIVELGRSLECPLDRTWSCYEGGTQPCGQCGACIEREGALA